MEEGEGREPPKVGQLSLGGDGGGKGIAVSFVLSLLSPAKQSNHQRQGGRERERNGWNERTKRSFSRNEPQKVVH